ncbi:hypothetical protein AVEN_247979-1 [Araneus ventricosus]|uniref:Uncharacterized protein n=1 Tax=Araneus ventricosus TaxID=182803 RepID=A0A4Y2CJK5_ARAVE|nr:hypothetical protein AVEN_247979-1 [Araneus ventricosus]
MVSVSASEPGGRELCSCSVFAIICNEFAMQACGKLAASSSYGDFEACVNLLVSHLHTCRDKFAESLQTCSASLLQICCKLKLLSGEAGEPSAIESAIIVVTNYLMTVLLNMKVLNCYYR